MSIVDELMPSRGRGRSQKVKETDQTPLEQAFSRPLPAGLSEAAAEVGAAVEALKIVKAAYREAQVQAKLTPGQRLDQAKRAVDNLRRIRSDNQSLVGDARRDLREAQDYFDSFKGLRSFRVWEKDEAEKALQVAGHKLARAEEKLKVSESRYADAVAAEQEAALDPVGIAQEALVRAETRRDVAERVGGDAPSAENIARLQQDFDRAKAAAAVPHKLKLDALLSEVDEHQARVRTAVQKLSDIFAPYRAGLTAAAEDQITEAIKLIEQAKALQYMLEDSSLQVPWLQQATGLPVHYEGEALQIDEASRNAIEALRLGSQHSFGSV